MSQTVITEAFEQWKAQQAANGQAVVLDEFVFANVPNLDVNAPIDRAAGMPAAAQIIYRQAVEKTGLVNENAVVYSVTLGADVGDFSFNWIGLTNKATGKLAMVVHAPLQSKVKNANGQQGNVLTRSFLMEYNGAEAQTLISTPAETWQIDFTARLAGMDEALRLANLDIYGAGAFFDTGFLVNKTGTQYFVTAGAGYVGGLRAALAANANITVTTKPVKVWADVSYHGTLTSAYQTDIKFTLATTLANYAQSGINHYVFALASIDANGVITDLRPKGSSLYLRRDKNLSDVADPVAALDTLNGVPKTRKINDKPLSADITLTPADVGALPAAGTAVAATKLATARKIAGVAFDGTADISLLPANVGALPAGGTAVAATKLATARKIAGVAFDGTKDIALAAANVDGLGSAATKDVGTAVGDLMEVGAYGLGGNAVVATDANAIVKNGFYKLTKEGTHGPTYQAAAEIIHIQFDGASANQMGWNAGVGNGTMYHRARAGSVFGEWIPLLDQSGGTLKGDNALLVLQNTAAAADKKALYIRGLNSDGAMRWYVGNGSAGNDSVQLANYATGAQLQLTDMCTINKPLKVTGNFDATGSGNFPGGVASAAGVTLNSSALVGMYFGADAASFTNANLLLKSWNGIGFYNTCPTSGIQGITGYINVRTGNMEMKSTITPGDYANFDARFYTKTLANTTFTKVGVAYTKGESDGRYNLKNTASLGANGWHKDPTTGLITQWGTITASGAGWQTVTFPTAFPSVCLNVQVTMINSSQGKFADNYGTAGSVTRTNFLCGRDNQGAYWEAKGY